MHTFYMQMNNYDIDNVYILYWLQVGINRQIYYSKSIFGTSFICFFQAFVRAWKDACAYHGRSRVWIPRGIYFIRSVSFEGPCKGSMDFIIKGTLLAPINYGDFFKIETWIGFRYIDRLTVKGGGYLDGRGASTWKYNDCRSNPRCNPLPAVSIFI